MSEPMLVVRDLEVTLHTEEGVNVAATGVSFDVSAGEALGLVGESGSGKSIVLRAILGLLPPYATVRGSAKFAGVELIGSSEKVLARVRGRSIGMVFQDPMTALNPIRTVGGQLTETLRFHRGSSRSAARREVLDMFEQVGIPQPAAVARSYPHQLSGGMRQRALIAMALAGRPQILMCDEPTTALDVTIQAQVLDLLREVSAAAGTALVFVSHDLAVVEQLCDRVVVMYAGRLAEAGPIESVFSDPRHVYTQALLTSLPSIDGPRTRPVSIDGDLPDRFVRLSGCRFEPRCPRAQSDCSINPPDLVAITPSHGSACVLRDASLPPLNPAHSRSEAR